MNLLLVADIGGTNARFGLLTFDPSCPTESIDYTTREQVTLRCADYPSMEAMVRDCYVKLGNIQPDFACFGIAGPIDDGIAQMTNINWKFSVEELRGQLGLKKLHVINDFAAMAYSVPFLKDEDLATLYAADRDPTLPIVVMGPGTGFGMAGLIPSSHSWQIVATEGGHASFAPTNEKELAIKSFLLSEQNHISIENVLSGNGLVNLYRAVAHIAKVEPQPYSPADVSGHALNGTDPICRQAVETFCEILGEVAGDKALSWGAKGGVVIGGGITPKLMSILKDTQFIERYKNKGPMASYVDDISIRLILNDKASLVGAAAYLIHNTDGLKLNAV